MKNKETRCCYYCRRPLPLQQMLQVDHPSGLRWLCDRCRERRQRCQPPRPYVSHHELLGGRWRVLARRSCA